MPTNPRVTKLIHTAAYQTPCYVYDLHVLNEQIQILKKAFAGYPNWQPYYTAKANGHPTILQTVSRSGLGLAVSSEFELQAAKRAGAKSISYTAPYIPMQIRTDRTIQINYNNFSELPQHGHSLGLRINPEIGWSFLPDHSSAGVMSQFGEPISALAKCNLSLITRLHMHTSSDSYRTDIFLTALKRLLKVVNRWPNITTINIGGGLATPIADDREFNLVMYAREIVRLLRVFEAKTGRSIRLQIEPGSFLIRSAGHYVCQVTALERKFRKMFYFTNATTHHLRGLSNLKKIDFGVANKSRRTESLVVGCTCQRSDVIYHGLVPKMKVSEKIIIPMAGAYCAAQADNFHLLAKPLEYFIKRAH